MRAWVLGGGGLLLAIVLFATLADGGPSPVPEGGGLVGRPAVERWTLLAAGSDTADGRLCDETTPCDRARQRALADAPCAWTARVWLASAPALVLRDVEDTVFALATRESGAFLQSTFAKPWTGGWWWKAESERVEVAAPVPCDTTRLSLTFNLEGRTSTGRLVQAAQTAEVDL